MRTSRSSVSSATWWMRSRIREEPCATRANTCETSDRRSQPNRIGGAMSNGTPEQVLASIVDGINTGNLDSLMPLYESQAAFATQPGNLNHGLPGVREALAGFIAMKGTLDLKVTRVLEASDLALVTTAWSFTGTGPDGESVKLAAN